jgi:S-adenosylmethionine:tRNA ribosyltransferase-isomerase
VRLLVSDRRTDIVVHTRFDNLPRFLSRGDLLVANDSGTLPAEVTARRHNGSQFALRFSTGPRDGLWVVEPRDVQIEPCEKVTLPGRAQAVFLSHLVGTRRLWLVDLTLPVAFVPYLLEWGRPIRYSYVPEPWPLQAYQTEYHGELGSAEMPSAGRPFTLEMIERLAEQGIGFVKLTLHTGVSSPEAHEPPFAEYFRVPAETARAVQLAKERGGRVIAVGTTVVRALESAADQRGVVHAAEGWTDLVVTPERGMRVVDGMLTGFHEPNASHLAMLESLASREHLAMAYRAALDHGYLWHEFGDVHLIL